MEQAVLVDLELAIQSLILVAVVAVVLLLKQRLHTLPVKSFIYMLVEAELRSRPAMANQVKIQK
jgi:hypothetical protein